ncbi:MAG: hypothetical protein MI866_00160 [Bacteroidales bacterium]|nr:hypothetical protein [Bacteroidales bacterium]
MNLNKLFFILLISLLLLNSCDIAGRLDIVNRTGETAYYCYYTQDNQGAKDTVLIEISGGKGDNIETILMGFGHTWSKAQIKEYTNRIEKIEMVTGKDTTLLTDKSEMFDFFLAHRKGPFHKTVKIVLE